ncbi:MAG: pyridoxine 5'-phosphate synthase [Candidatus Goldbacteria bacterium]|nr:pyridoxine 5'-phosphate synthase [Candidatus Goldiibacteriota bacterium]
MANLCVNIDHVATIRQVRGGVEPDLVQAAKIVENAGATGITIHLREDRRHIQDKDVYLLKKVVKTKLNLEMSINQDIVNVAVKIIPNEATIVPEKRQELTTEGGLDVVNNFKKIKEITWKLQKKGISVSLFINPDIKQIKFAKETGADFIELHTGRYADAKNSNAVKKEFLSIKKSAYFAHSIGLNINAGHGLNYKNVLRIAKIPVIEDLNIGHSIISRAIMVGLEKAVKDMIKLIK